MGLNSGFKGLNERYAWAIDPLSETMRFI